MKPIVFAGMARTKLNDSEAGFIVQITKVNDLVTTDEAVRMGLNASSGEIYYCTK